MNENKTNINWFPRPVSKSLLNTVIKQKRSNFMKKILKKILAVICWIIGLVLLYETLCSLKGLDSWGLGFAFYTLPVGIISILFLVEAIILTKDFINKKGSDKNVKY